MGEVIKPKIGNEINTMVGLIKKDLAGTDVLSDAVKYCIENGRELDSLYIGDGVDCRYSKDRHESLKAITLFDEKTNNIYVIAVSQHEKRDVICVAEGNLSETTFNKFNVAKFVFYRRDKRVGMNNNYVDMDYSENGGITVSNVLGKEVNTNNKEGINPEECKYLSLYLGSSGKVGNKDKANALIKRVFTNIKRLSMETIKSGIDMALTQEPNHHGAEGRLTG